MYCQYHLLITLALISPSSTLPRVTVRLGYGTLFHYQGRILINPKPLVAIRTISLAFLYEGFNNVSTQVKKFNEIANNIDPEMHVKKNYPDLTKALNWDTVLAPDVDYFAKNYLQPQTLPNTDLNSGVLFQRMMLTALKVLKGLVNKNNAPLEEGWYKLQAQLRTSFTGLTQQALRGREKRTPALLGVIVPLIKMAGSAAIPIIIERVANLARSKTNKEIIPELQNSSTKVVQLQPVKAPTTSLMDLNDLYKDIPFASSIDHIAYKMQNGDLSQAQKLKHDTVVDILGTASDSLKDMQSEQGRLQAQLLAQIHQVAQGTVPAAFINPEIMDQIKKAIDVINAGSDITYSLPVAPANIDQLYPLLHPLILTESNFDKNNNSNIDVMHLYLFFPLVTPDSRLDVHKVSTLPFLTKEGIPVQLKNPMPYFATNANYDKNAAFDHSTWNNCQRLGEDYYCSQPQPLQNSKEDCLTAILSGEENFEIISRYCTFEKARTDRPLFQYITANTYAFYLPKPSLLKIICAKTGADHLTIKSLPRTGIFTYDTGCTATLSDFHFQDTSTEVVQDISTNASSLTFRDMLHKMVPDLVLQDSAIELATSFSANITRSQSIRDIITKTQMADLTAKQQSFNFKFDHELPNVMFNFIMAMVALALSNGFLFTYCTCTRKFAKRQHRVPQVVRTWKPLKKSRSLDNFDADSQFHVELTKGKAADRASFFQKQQEMQRAFEKRHETRTLNSTYLNLSRDDNFPEATSLPLRTDTGRSRSGQENSLKKANPSFYARTNSTTNLANQLNMKSM